MKSEIERLEDEGFPGELIQREFRHNCDKVPGGWGIPMDDYEYIWYGNADELEFNDIVTEFRNDITVCPPYYHRKGQIDSLRVNEDIQGPYQNGPFDVYSSRVTFSNDIVIVGSVETSRIRGAGQVGAAATAIIFGGSVIAINVTAGGTGYINDPSITFIGGGGIGAAATTTVYNGSVTAITVSPGGGGIGYTTAPKVIITGGGTGVIHVDSTNVTFSDDIEVLGSVGTSSIRGAGGTGVIRVDSTLVTFSNNIRVLGSVTAPTFVGNLTGNLTGVASGNKLFDIPHVTQKGKRIRHIIAEGPEAGIYVRGKIKDTNVIELPEYWDGLVDPETITVTLTQIGHSQDLIVDKINLDKNIIIRSGSGTNIHCYYEIWASRWINPMNHDEKLIVVYDGETPDDYPGDNKQFLIGGWDYDRRTPYWEPLDKTSSVVL